MPNAAQFIGQSFPSSVQPGATFPASVTLKNIGDTIWGTAGPNFHKLGSQTPTNNTFWGSQRFALPNNVLPGEEVTINLSLTAPFSVGYPTCDWKMLQENVVWFGPLVGGRIFVGDATFFNSSKTLPGPTADPLDVIGGQIIDSSPYVMDGLRHRIRWTNLTGRKLLLRKAYLWSGVQGGSSADVHAELYRVSDNASILLNQWDRYAEPTAPNNGIYTDFDPYMVINPDDGIEMLHFGIQFNGSGKLAHHGATIWVQYAPQS